MAQFSDQFVCLKSRVRLFADDTAMYLTDSLHIEEQTLQNELLSLEQWENIWESR